MKFKSDVSVYKTDRARCSLKKSITGLAVKCPGTSIKASKLELGSLTAMKTVSSDVFLRV